MHFWCTFLLMMPVSHTKQPTSTFLVVVNSALLDHTAHSHSVRNCQLSVNFLFSVPSRWDLLRHWFAHWEKNCWCSWCLRKMFAVNVWCEKKGVCKKLSSTKINHVSAKWRYSKCFYSKISLGKLSLFSLFFTNKSTKQGYCSGTKGFVSQKLRTMANQAKNLAEFKNGFHKEKKLLTPISLVKKSWNLLQFTKSLHGKITREKLNSCKAKTLLSKKNSILVRHCKVFRIER